MNFGDLDAALILPAAQPMLSVMQNPERVIALALHGSLPNNPNAGDGKTWDQHSMSLEEAEHHAKVIMAALKEAGLKIVSATDA